MDNLKFYYMPNCWIINLKPFDKDTDNERISNFQQDCHKNNIFGIGWYADYFSNHAGEISLNKVSKDEYLGYCQKQEKNTARDAAVDRISKVRCGDLAIMRLRDGHIYLGKIKKEAFHNEAILKNESAKKLSWMCEVEKWHDLGDGESVPSEILGRFSQKMQPTITRVANYKQRMLILALYKTATDQKADVPKLILNENNFARALNYMDLEDLVCFYIYEKHADEGYMLLPSSGKVNQIKYEFRFVNTASDKKPITCQVKNQNSTSIDIDEYENDKDDYEKIYLFSGNNNYKGKATDNIEIIDSKELFQFLRKFNYMHEKLSKYHTFSEGIDLSKLVTILKEKGWKEFKGKIAAFKKRRFENEFMIGKNEEKIDWIAFENYFFYITDEFDGFVIDSREADPKLLSEIQKSLEEDLK